ncbi:PIN domain nuclease, partial [Thermococci archaeon]
LIYLNTLTNLRYRILYENFYIEILTKYKPYTDVLVLDELIYISKKKYNIPYNVSIKFVETNILPYTTVLNLGEEEYKYATEVIAKHNLKPSDALHIGAMMNNNITLIVSEDRGFDRISAVKRLWIE